MIWGAHLTVLGAAVGTETRDRLIRRRAKHASAEREKEMDDIVRAEGMGGPDIRAAVEVEVCSEMEGGIVGADFI